MAIQDHTGRIDRTSFVVSTGFFLGIALVAVIFRFVVRFAIQKQRFQIEDGLIVLATVLNLTASIMLYDRVVDPMYLLAAIQHKIPGVQIPTNLIPLSETFHKWVTASLMICWTSISTVKFFFLLFFWKLIDRLRVWKIYWWIVFFFNIFIITFGITIYYIACPYWGEKALYCPSGAYMSSLIRYSAAQIALDILGDLLILVIPIGLLWRIRVNLVQKLALSSSLCLTVLLIALSITRVAGLIWQSEVDDIWEAYWIIMSANIGVFLAAASAFRTFFVAHKNSKARPYPPLRTPVDDSENSKKYSTMRSRGRLFNPIEDSSSELGTITRIDEPVESGTMNDMVMVGQEGLPRNGTPYPVTVGEQV